MVTPGASKPHDELGEPPRGDRVPPAASLRARTKNACARCAPLVHTLVPVSSQPRSTRTWPWSAPRRDRNRRRASSCRSRSSTHHGRWLGQRIRSPGLPYRSSAGCGSPVGDPVRRDRGGHRQHFLGDDVALDRRAGAAAVLGLPRSCPAIPGAEPSGWNPHPSPPASCHSAAGTRPPRRPARNSAPRHAGRRSPGPAGPALREADHGLPRPAGPAEIIELLGVAESGSRPRCCLHNAPGQPGSLAPTAQARSTSIPSPRPGE